MDPFALQMLAPMLVAITAILTIGGVLILRPIAKRLGDLLDVMTRERLQPRDSADMEHLRDILETMSQRLALIEEKQDFMDRLNRPQHETPALKRSPDEVD